MEIIGLTGGIGSGKSTVLAFFKELGALSYVADVEAKKLINTDLELRSQIKKLFGEKAFVKGKLNSDYIAALVFNDEKKLHDLNGLVHPKVREDFQHFIKKTNADFVFYEAAILFESSSNQFCDYVITVIADFGTRIERIKKRDGISEAQILERMKHQSTDDFKINKSDFVIRNNNLKHTESQVLILFKLLEKLKNQ